ncbi:MAG: hypothetical protein WBP59_13160 [Ilumatobacteraceae bacterium]
MRYRHTQHSIWGIALAVLVPILIALSIWAGGSGDLGGPWVYLVCGFLALVLFDASRLTVTVDDAAVTATFGLGWPRRRTPFAEIVDVRRQRVRWFHGWGIRKVAGGWMFNTSGWNAVELVRENAAVFWIGTDQPDELMAAIDAARQS